MEILNISNFSNFYVINITYKCKLPKEDFYVEFIK